MPVPQKHSEWRRVVYEVMEITRARFFRSANISVKSPMVKYFRLRYTQSLLPTTHFYLCSTKAATGKI